MSCFKRLHSISQYCRPPVAAPPHFVRTTKVALPVVTEEQCQREADVFRNARFPSAGSPIRADQAPPVAFGASPGAGQVLLQYWKHIPPL
jgi:hypothetical protein